MEKQFNEDVLNMVGQLIELYIEENPLSFSNPQFHENLFQDVYNLALIQTQFVYDETEVTESIYEAFTIYFTYILPLRSYDCLPESEHDVEKIKNIVQYLIQIPQPEQRTEEWYMFRHKYLTASSIWKAFGTESSKNQLIYSKCAPLDVEKYSHFNLESPLHWGQKYERVSIMWYEHTYSTQISEFGCIPHKDISYIAASPDGIVLDEASPRYGRMLEVKNIVNREITGVPKYEYWIQMQVQMEVCDLNECDFLETRFIEYDDLELFEKDGGYITTCCGKPKGCMILFLDEMGQPLYEYSPWGVDKDEIEKWSDEIMQRHHEKTWLKNIYWKLDQVSIVCVVRNKRWFNAAIPLLDSLWNIIEKERIEGYQHRAPNKRPKSIKQTWLVNEIQTEAFTTVNI
jgi:putative phage-type endonuclease